MARARKSHVRTEEETKPVRGLRPAYRHGKPGSNPYVVYADLKNDSTTRVLILTFGEYYSAKYFIDQLIDGDSWEDCDPVGSRTGIITSTGIRITMFNGDLFKILDYEPTELEKEWEDEQLRRKVFRLKYARDPDSSQPERDREEISDNVSRRSRGNRSDNDGGTRKERREPRPKVDKTGLVSANDIAKELGVEGKDVRGVLRALKLEKPEGGWLFDKKTAEQIREKVKKGLKEGKKK